MTIIDKLLTPNKYSRGQRSLKKVTKVVVHYVGNPGSSAIGNRNYFESLKTGITYITEGGTTAFKCASSHYIVGLSGEIIRCVPEDEIAYTSNSANSYSIGIEVCHPDATGKFSAITQKALVELVADVCKRYGLDPINDVIRHFDVTGKRCPLWFVTHPEDFLAFKKEVFNLMNGTELNKEVEKIVSTLLVKKVITDKNYWSAVLKGDKTCNPEYLRIILGRLIN